MPHNLAASFIMSTVTSAVLGKTSCLEKQKEKLPTLSLPHPLPSLLSEKIAAYILPIALYVKIERSCCMPICLHILPTAEYLSAALAGVHTSSIFQGGGRTGSGTAFRNVDLKGPYIKQ